MNWIESYLPGLTRGAKIFLGILLLMPTLGGIALIWLAANSAPGELGSRVGVGIGGAATILFVPAIIVALMLRRKIKYGTFKQTEAERAALAAANTEYTAPSRWQTATLLILWCCVIGLHVWGALHHHDIFRWLMVATFVFIAIATSWGFLRRRAPVSE
jgi:hypothetical protein